MGWCRYSLSLRKGLYKPFSLLTEWEFFVDFSIRVHPDSNFELRSGCQKCHLSHRPLNFQFLAKTSRQMALIFESFFPELWDCVVRRRWPLGSSILDRCRASIGNWFSDSDIRSFGIREKWISKVLMYMGVVQSPVIDVCLHTPTYALVRITMSNKVPSYISLLIHCIVLHPNLQ